MGLPDREAHMPQCSPWAPARLPEAWRRLVQASSLTRVRQLAADRELVEDRESVQDDLLCHRSSREAVEPGPPPTRARAKL
jgi:hypothetical protein